MLIVGKLKEEEIRNEYKENVTRALNEEQKKIREDADAEEVFECFKNVVLRETKRVVGEKVREIGRN